MCICVCVHVCMSEVVMMQITCVKLAELDKLKANCGKYAALS